MTNRKRANKRVKSATTKGAGQIATVSNVISFPQQASTIQVDGPSVIGRRDDLAFARLKAAVKRKAADILGVRVAYVCSDAVRFFLCADGHDAETRRAVSKAIVEIEDELGHTLDGHFAPSTDPIEDFTVAFSR